MRVSPRLLTAALAVATVALAVAWAGLRCRGEEPHPQGRFLDARHVADMLTDDLALTANQCDELDRLLADKESELVALRREYRQVGDLFREFETRVGDFLDPHEQERLRELLGDHRRQRWERRKARETQCRDNHGAATAPTALAATAPTEGTAPISGERADASDIEALVARMELDAPTARQLAGAIGDLFAAYDRVRASVKPRYRALVADVEARLKPMLSDEQLSRLEDLKRLRQCMR